MGDERGAETLWSTRTFWSVKTREKDERSKEKKSKGNCVEEVEGKNKEIKKKKK